MTFNDSMILSSKEIVLTNRMIFTNASLLIFNGYAVKIIHAYGEYDLPSDVTVLVNGSVIFTDPANGLPYVAEKIPKSLINRLKMHLFDFGIEHLEERIRYADILNASGMQASTGYETDFNHSDIRFV